MAPLPASVQYGLSSESYKDNKELFFVKLTDSALKAIEAFLKNKRNESAIPKIQFLPGNEGKISIPSPASGDATFTFNINTNAEMEGAQSSLECVTSVGARRLETCGPLPSRMCVHANDDTYAAAWKRMASAVAAAERAERVQRPKRPERQERLKWIERLQRRQRLVPPAVRPQLLPAAPSHQQYAQHQQHPLNPHHGTAAAVSVTVLPDEPPHKKRRITHYRRLSPPSVSYATTSSSKRQAEDLRSNPGDLKTVRLDDIKKIALQKVFGWRKQKS